MKRKRIVDGVNKLIEAGKFDENIYLANENIESIKELIQTTEKISLTSTDSAERSIAIGYIINSTGSFNWALVFVSFHAFLAIVSYLLIVGKIQRLELETL